MRDFFANLFKCTSETMVERVKSPIVGTFIFVWLFYNWKVILILLFSKVDVENKINIISGYITAKSFYYPFSIAVLYCVAIPIVTLFIDVLLRKPSEAAIELRYEKINKEYIEKEKAEKLRANADIAYERQKTGAEKEIQEMKFKINESKQKEGVLTKERDEAILKSDELEIEINNYENLVFKLQKELDKEKTKSSSLEKDIDYIYKNNKNVKSRRGTLLSGNNILRL
ncbi:TPA: hypothetical protein RG731_002567 [Morganella morganii subsp. morganii]|nr:hypothetical protein [Morganella morganii subsp. morganii]